MNNRVLFSIVAIMAVACFAIMAESETTGPIAPDLAIDLTAVPDLAIVNPAPVNPDDWQIVSNGPNLAGGAYLDCPRYSYGQGYYDCSCGGYGIYGNRARPFWERGPVRRGLRWIFCRRFRRR